MKFDENLRDLRKEKGYSQEELADRLNVTRQTVSKWENGSAMPDLKKLTELAEFFGVSMDRLLGLDVDYGTEAGRDTSNFEAYVQYTNQRIAALEESRNQEFKKKLIILISVFTVALCLFFILFLNYSSGIRNELNSMSNMISYLQNQTYYTGNPSGDNDWESKSADVTVSFLSVDSEKPYIVKAQLKYSPTSYTKGSKVYFAIPKEDKSIERLEATEENGEFVLTTEIDISIDGAFYLFLEEGDENIREEFYIDPIYTYCDLLQSAERIYYSISKNQGYLSTEYTLENIFDEFDIYFWSVASNKLNSAEFIVESETEEVFKQSLEIMHADDGKRELIKLSDYPLKTKLPQNIRAYVKLIDELGTTYKCYVNIDSDLYDGYAAAHTVIVFSDGTTLGEFEDYFY